jgi:hypothetical protein
MTETDTRFSAEASKKKKNEIRNSDEKEQRNMRGIHKDIYCYLSTLPEEKQEKSKHNSMPF